MESYTTANTQEEQPNTADCQSYETEEQIEAKFSLSQELKKTADPYDEEFSKDFCAICMQVMVEPVTLECNHSFCG